MHIPYNNAIGFVATYYMNCDSFSATFWAIFWCFCGCATFSFVRVAQPCFKETYQRLPDESSTKGHRGGGGGERPQQKGEEGEERGLCGK